MRLAGNGSSVYKVVRIRRCSYIWTKLEVAGAADNVLVDGIVKMAVQDFLGQSQRALKPAEA